MNLSSPSASHQPALGAMALSLNLDELSADSVRFRLMGSKLLIDGSVPTYEAKRRIEAAARAAGYKIDNWLRVVPGVSNQ